MRNPLPHLDLKILTKSLSFVSSAKVLGIWLQEDLKWDSQIDHLGNNEFVLTQFGLLVFGSSPLRPLPKGPLFIGPSLNCPFPFALLLVRPFTTSSSYCLGLPCLVLLYIVLSRFCTLHHGNVSFLSSYCFGLLILALFHFVDYFFVL